MLDFSLAWCLWGFLGWCVFVIRVVIEDGVSSFVRRTIADWWFTILFFVVCIVGGLFSLVGSFFITHYLPRS